MRLLIKYRVVVDTNIFVSAILRKGNPAKILTLWRQNKILLLLSPYLASEILSVLGRLKVKSAYMQELTHRLENHSIPILPFSRVTLCRDPKDNEILALALDGTANFLISGDSDLLTLGKIKGIAIVKPKEFLKIIKSQKNYLR